VPPGGTSIVAGSKQHHRIDPMLRTGTTNMGIRRCLTAVVLVAGAVVLGESASAQPAATGTHERTEVPDWAPAAVPVAVGDPAAAASGCNEPHCGPFTTWWWDDDGDRHEQTCRLWVNRPKVVGPANQTVWGHSDISCPHKGALIWNWTFYRVRGPELGSGCDTSGNPETTQCNWVRQNDGSGWHLPRNMYLPRTVWPENYCNSAHAHGNGDSHSGSILCRVL
jgi:hypothetical protein